MEWFTEKEGKEEYLCSAFLHQGTHKALRHGSHSFTCKQHHACLSFASVHQMAPPQQLRQQTSNCSLLLIYRPGKDERLSWPGWLTCTQQSTCCMLCPFTLQLSLVLIAPADEGLARLSCPGWMVTFRDDLPAP